MLIFTSVAGGSVSSNETKVRLSRRHRESAANECTKFEAAALKKMGITCLGRGLGRTYGPQLRLPQHEQLRLPLALVLPLLWTISGQAASVLLAGCVRLEKSGRAAVFAIR